MVKWFIIISKFAIENPDFKIFSDDHLLHTCNCIKQTHVSKCDVIIPNSSSDVLFKVLNRNIVKWIILIICKVLFGYVNVTL